MTPTVIAIAHSRSGVSLLQAQITSVTTRLCQSRRHWLLTSAVQTEVQNVPVDLQYQKITQSLNNGISIGTQNIMRLHDWVQSIKGYFHRVVTESVVFRING